MIWIYLTPPTSYRRKKPLSWSRESAWSQSTSSAGNISILIFFGRSQRRPNLSAIVQRPMNSRRASNGSSTRASFVKNPGLIFLALATVAPQLFRNITSHFKPPVLPLTLSSPSRIPSALPLGAPSPRAIFGVRTHGPGSGEVPGGLACSLCVSASRCWMPIKKQRCRRVQWCSLPACRRVAVVDPSRLLVLPCDTPVTRHGVFGAEDDIISTTADTSFHRTHTPITKPMM